MWVAALLLLQVAAPAASQSVDVLDGGAPGTTAMGEMSALLEVTIFNIDVLTLTVRTDSASAMALRGLASRIEDRDELADSVAQVMLAAPRLWARQIFHRGVSLGRLVGGMSESSKQAVAAGFITPEYHAEFTEALPTLFGFLEEDGAAEGDEIFFSVEGDVVRTEYRTVDGAILLSERREDAQARRGSIPSFFAPGSRFRERLVESLRGPVAPGGD